MNHLTLLPSPLFLLFLVFPRFVLVLTHDGCCCSGYSSCSHDGLFSCCSCCSYDGLSLFLLFLGVSGVRVCLSSSSFFVNIFILITSSCSHPDLATSSFFCSSAPAPPPALPPPPSPPPSPPPFPIPSLSPSAGPLTAVASSGAPSAQEEEDGSDEEEEETADAPASAPASAPAADGKSKIDDVE